MALLAEFLQLCLALVERVALAPLLCLVFLQRSLGVRGEGSELLERCCQGQARSHQETGREQAGLWQPNTRGEKNSSLCG